MSYALGLDFGTNNVPALIEATAFGARVIIERLEEYGVPIPRAVCCGGIAEKNGLLLQIYADVIGRALQVAGSSQTCALGAALAASVLAGPTKGGHPDVPTAQRAMTSLKDLTYEPAPKRHETYTQLYHLYRTLHDAIGTPEKLDLSQVMKAIIDLKSRAYPPLM